MGYYSESPDQDTSGLFPTLKGCIAAAEGLSEEHNEPYKVYAQTSTGDRLVGKTAEYTDCRDINMWIFDYDDSWKFERV